MFILRENKQSVSRITAALPNARGSTSEAATPHLGVNGKERTDGVHQRDEKKLKANKQKQSRAQRGCKVRAQDTRGEQSHRPHVFPFNPARMFANSPPSTQEQQATSKGLVTTK